MKLFSHFLALTLAVLVTKQASAQNSAPAPLELGQLLSRLLPPAGTARLNWDHLSNDNSIVWLDSPYRTETWKNGDDLTVRQGVARINVMGRYSTILKQRKEELPWTIRMESKGNPKFGVEVLHVHAGLPNQGCFGLPYEGCEFEVEASLSNAKLSAKRVCREETVQTRVTAFEVSKPGSASVALVHTVGWGSGGSEARIKLLLPYQASSALCRS